MALHYFQYGWKSEIKDTYVYAHTQTAQLIVQIHQNLTMF